MIEVHSLEKQRNEILTPAEQQHLFVQLAKLLYERQDPYDIRNELIPADVLLFDALDEHMLGELKEYLFSVMQSLDYVHQELAKRIKPTAAGHREDVKAYAERKQQIWKQLIAEKRVEYAEAEKAQTEKDSSSPVTH